MEHPFGALSLLPPLLAIALAIATRQVYLSLAAGLWVGQWVLAGYHPLDATIGMINDLVAVFADAGNTRVLMFCVLVGALIALVQRSGGVAGFVERVQAAQLASTRSRAGLLALAVGGLIFIESSISCLTTGTIARPLFDRLQISREKLAYICDTSSAPICVLAPLNGWGAFVLAQLALAGVEAPVALIFRAVPLNFYALVSLVMLVFIIVTQRDFGPMRRAERRAREEGKLHADNAQPMVTDETLAMHPDPGVPLRAINFMLPIAVMMALVPIGLYYTGVRNLEPDAPRGFWIVLEQCSGSTAVLWAVLGGVIAAGVLYRVQGIMKVGETVNVALVGAGSLLPLTVLMLFAFSLGGLCGKDGLQTGTYVASLVPPTLPAYLAAPVIFVTASAIAFSTGTSWGTFAIMIPIALPIADRVDMSPALALAGVLGGGVFGDHCSPISDTTIVSSMAAACDHIDHVRTQLPYALLAGTIAIASYALAGALL